MTHRSPKNLNNPLRKLYKLELSMPAESKKNPACTCPREKAPKNQPNKLSRRISHIEIRVRDRASAQQPASAKKRGEGQRVLSLSPSLFGRLKSPSRARQKDLACALGRGERTHRRSEAQNVSSIFCLPSFDSSLSLSPCLRSFFSMTRATLEEDLSRLAADGKRGVRIYVCVHV